jgi:hypothetical protein
MSKLQLADNFYLPIDAVTESVGILAVKRAGKSHTAKKLAEQLFYAGQQIVIIDPKGDWWGIRSSADGREAGLPIVIVGGEHADVPLEVNSGELVARMIVEDRVSMLIDLAELRKEKVPVFMSALLETLYRLKAKEQYRTPMMLIIDEADAIAPQKAWKGHEERMLGAAEDIVRRGGQRGIGITLVTQRAAVLNKNVLTQVGILVLLRTTGSQDIDAVDEWIKKHGQPEERKQVMDTIASMERGTAWFWAPGWPTAKGIFHQVKIGPIDTFDSGATPKAGQKRKAPKTLADVDLNTFRTKMADTIERAKANDPAQIKKQLDAVTKELQAERNKKLPAPPAAAPEIDYDKLEDAHQDAAGIAIEADRKWIEAYLVKVRKWVAGIVKALEAVEDPIGDLENELDMLESDLKGKFTDVPRLTSKRKPSSKFATAPFVDIRPTKIDEIKPLTSKTYASGGVTDRVLGAIAELNAIGISEPPRVQVAFLAGYSHPQSTGFVKAIGALRTSGLIAYPSPGTLAFTDEGKSNAPVVDEPLTNEQLQERIMGLVGGVFAKVLKVLIESYPDPIERTTLAQATDYTHPQSTGFVKAIGRLRSLGLAEYPSAGTIKASSMLFFE